MRRFTRLYLDLDSTTASSRKIELLSEYFRQAPPADAAVALYYLTGERPKRLLPSKVMRDAVLEATGVPPWLLDECYASVGDFSETAALLLDNPLTGAAPAQAPGSPDHVPPADLSLVQVFETYVLPLGHLDTKAQRDLLLEAWSRFDTDQRLVFNKVIRGGFRVGVQRAMVIHALADATGLARDDLAHRLTGGVTPTAQWLASLIAADAAPALSLSRAYPFFLANQLDTPPEALGPRDDWIAEPKYDGIRAQLIRRGGQSWLWSRGEESIGAQFPDILGASRALPDGVVLDGEVLVFRGERPLPFAVLQTRLGRKGPPVERGLFDDDHVVFVAFDLLEQAGVDLRTRALADRRGQLEGLLSLPGLDRATIRPIQPAHDATWDELARVRERSRDRGIEGLVLKHRLSPYLVGRTRPADGRGWWKWKIDPLSIDAVLIYAQPGSGRRAGLHTDCTFALWDTPTTDNPDAALVPFAKAYSGLTQDEIESLDAWIQRHTTTKRGPVREVTPHHVFEIGFEGIAESTRHRSGIAVRFPRILKWRTDKRPEDANTIDDLRSMLRA